MGEEKIDVELNAIQTLIDVLTPLKLEQQKRVLEYVFNRLRISPQQITSVPGEVGVEKGQALPSPSTPSVETPPITDIRSLREAKNPRSAIEMAVLVAYYLKNIAPSDERKDAITHSDIEKYFPQANFLLPRSRLTLNNAKSAGYLDGVGDGVFRLNPVGHNLVTHTLPGKKKASTAQKKKSKPRVRKRTPKKVKKKTTRKKSRAHRK